MHAFVLNVAAFNWDKKCNRFQFPKCILAAWMDDLSMFKGSWFSNGSVLKYSLLTVCVMDCWASVNCCSSSQCHCWHLLCWKVRGVLCHVGLPQHSLFSKKVHVCRLLLTLLLLLSQVSPARTWYDETKVTDDWATDQEGSSCPLHGIGPSSSCSWKNQELPTNSVCRECKGAVREPGEVLGVKRSENNFLKEKNRAVAFLEVVSQVIPQEENLLKMHSFLEHPKGTAALVCFPKCSLWPWLFSVQ